MGTSEEMTKEERIEYWEMVLEDFNQSGLNKTCYCQNNDIPVSTLNYWSNRLRELQASKESSGDRFIELQVPEGNEKSIYYTNRFNDSGLKVIFFYGDVLYYLLSSYSIT
ncbi:MAG: hypothetical protein K6E63_07090 [Lachnospiraceae bacterium]|nr:hypothetical protein [Lachnospiraceae bacterium]